MLYSSVGLHIFTRKKEERNLFSRIFLYLVYLQSCEAFKGKSFFLHHSIDAAAQSYLPQQLKYQSMLSNMDNSSNGGVDSMKLHKYNRAFLFLFVPRQCTVTVCRYVFNENRWLVLVLCDSQTLMRIMNSHIGVRCGMSVCACVVRTAKYIKQVHYVDGFNSISGLSDMTLKTSSNGYKSCIIMVFTQQKITISEMVSINVQSKFCPETLSVAEK